MSDAAEYVPLESAARDKNVELSVVVADERSGDSILCSGANEGAVVVGGVDGQLQVFDAQTLASIARIKAHDGWVVCLAVSGDVVASGGADKVHSQVVESTVENVAQVGLDNGPIFVFNLNSGDKIFALEGHKMAVNSLNCAESGADGASILFSGCTDSTTRVWNLSSGECLGELRGTHSASVNCTTLFSSRLYTGSTDGSIACVSVDNGQTLHTYHGHEGAVFALSVVEAALLSGGADCTIRVWDPANISCIRILTGHLDWVNTLSIACGSLFSGSVDKSVRCWKVNAITIPDQTSAEGIASSTQRAFSAEPEHSTLSYDDCDVVAMGAGGDGQLGRGSSAPSTTPIHSDLKGIAIAAIDAGGHAEEFHSVAVAEDGALYVWGSNRKGQLGVEKMNFSSTPTRVTALDAWPVRLVACGGAHTLVVPAGGAVLSFGWGHFGQLGHGDEKASSTPRQVMALADVRITNVAAGSGHSIALSEAGNVYSWGWGANGQLGHGDEKNINKPRAIISLKDKVVSQLACGLAHTAVVSLECRGVYTWGWDEYGQLGHGVSMFSSKNKSPRAVAALNGKGVLEVACGSAHTIAVTGAGEVYAWGWGKDGQLGLGQWSKSKHTPSLVKTLSGRHIVSISCAGSHSACATESGSVLTWGGNSSGQLGIGDTNNRNSPQEVEKLFGLPIKGIACSGGLTDGHTLVLVDRQKVGKPRRRSVMHQQSSSALDESDQTIDAEPISTTLVAMTEASAAPSSVQEPVVAPNRGDEQGPQDTFQTAGTKQPGAGTNPQDSLKHLFKEINEQLTKQQRGLAATKEELKNKMLRFSQEQQAASERRTTALTSVLSLRDKLKALQEEEAHAANAEDFEVAEVAAEKARESEASANLEAQKAEEALREFGRVNEVCTSESLGAGQSLQTFSQKIKSIAQRHEATLNQFGIEASDTSLGSTTLQMERLRSMRSDLSDTLSDLEAQKRDAESNRAAAVEGVVGDLQVAEAQLENCVSERVAAEAALEAAKRRLAAACEAEAEALHARDAAQASVDTAGGQFDTVIRSVEVQMQRAVGQADRVDAEINAAVELDERTKQERQEMANIVEEGQKSVARMRECADAAQMEAEACSMQAEKIAEFGRHLQSCFEGSAVVVQYLVNGLSALGTPASGGDSSAVREIAFEAVKLEQEAAKLRQTVAQLEGKVGEITAKKTLAVSERNFKEASSLAAKVKELSGQLDAKTEALARVEQERTKAADALGSARGSGDDQGNAVKAQFLRDLKARRDVLQSLLHDAAESENYAAAELLSSELKAAEFVSNELEPSQKDASLIDLGESSGGVELPPMTDRDAQVAELESQLAEAVAAEDYEKAAQIDEQLRSLGAGQPSA